MLIECNNCHKKYTVKDSDIPNKGRTVQCGSCSTQWIQMPIDSTIATEKLNIKEDHYKSSPSAAERNLDEDDDLSQDLLKKEFTASNGKNYKFLGNQWAEVLPSGKSGRLARKKISNELNKLAGRKINKKSKTINKPNQDVNLYQETQSKGMGIFNFLIVLLLFVAAIILLLDTFKQHLIPIFPTLDNYLVYIFETLNNIYIIIKDLINNYK